MDPETQAHYYRQLLGIENGQNCIIPSNKSYIKQGALNNTCKRRQSQHNSGTLGGEIVDAYCLEICRAVEYGKHNQLEQNILELARRVACGIHKKASCATIHRFERHIDDIVIPHLFRLKNETNVGPFSLPQPLILSQPNPWPAPHAAGFHLGAYQPLGGPENEAYITEFPTIADFSAVYRSDSIQGSSEDSHSTENVFNQPELSVLRTTPPVLLPTSSTPHALVLSDGSESHFNGHLPVGPALFNNVNFRADNIHCGLSGSSSHCAETNNWSATSELLWFSTMS